MDPRTNNGPVEAGDTQMTLMTTDRPLQIGFLLFDQLDQIDLTGPFEVLTRLPHAITRLYGTGTAPVRDVNGLRLQADALLADAPQLDILVVPGGAGQQDLMEDEEVSSWLRHQAEGACCVLSVCTGALLLGAAGLLVGRRATTHWASTHLLAAFGAESVPERVVIDDRFVFAAGVTAGIDGALRVAASLCGDRVAQAIQLWIQYAPEPPFDAGTPETAPADLVAAARRSSASLTRRREASARRSAMRLGFDDRDPLTGGDVKQDPAVRQRPATGALVAESGERRRRA